MAKRAKLRKSGGRGPKSKGSTFERKMCSQLSLWVSDMTREDVFWRSSMSGGRATRSRMKSRKGRRPAKFETQEGDVSAIHPLGTLLLELFIIECKHLDNLMMDHYSWGLVGKQHKIWIPVCSRASELGREPLLIAKQNYRDILVATSENGARILEIGATLGVFEPTAIFPRIDMHVYLMRDMLSKLDFQLIRDYYSNIPA